MSDTPTPVPKDGAPGPVDLWIQADGDPRAYVGLLSWWGYTTTPWLAQFAPPEFIPAPAGTLQP